ncbi:S1 family peptidase [Amycolatopsis sp. H20-H5]|uniref:S1 family peptidase n=1 Tax=Amycolatopsis sp. H20-H5 TaxID=3046309 RepID=UPI002DB7A152|nr:trypsin-like serine protease [Amycolatopsis sp. H20-H5]MEC3980412.1 trypsin-like serine protease [Amycolatopsis sp. H20-H5]
MGGHEATGNTSWMASLQYDAPTYGRVAWHTCGAALLFRSWVVTNAHCVTDPPGDSGGIPTAAKSFSVRVGSKDRTQGGETAQVVKIVVHPGWQWSAGAPAQPVDDVALLQLDHPVNEQPIQLGGRAAKPGERVTLYGWGADQPDGGGNLPLKLQQLETKVLPPAKCADAGQSVGEICTSNPRGTDGPGPGDSGGPAVALVRGVPQLVGTCSRAAAQYPGEKPTVYTSEPDFRGWLYDTARGVPATS